jgi:hypothetical protein
MGDGVAGLISTNNPKLSAAASEEGAEVIGIDQNPAVFRQGDHLLWGGGGIELTSQLWVTIHPIQEVIQGIQ